MVRRQNPRSVYGFTTLEAVIALLILASVGVVAVMTVLKTSRSAVQIEKTKKAGTLAGMVVEQYNDYATSNFFNIPTYNMLNAAPKDFFHTPDNLGFEGMLLTTTATFSTDKLLCQVDITIAWQEGPSNKKVTFSKTYSERTPIFRGPMVYVYVKSPCPGNTSQEDIIANCPGLPGFEVTGPPATADHVNVNGTSESLAYTDNQGKALLRNLKAGDITIKVKMKASPWFVPSSSASFRQGYYATDPTTLQPVIQLTKNVSGVQEGTKTEILVTEFKPLSHISGRLENTSPAIAPGVLNSTGIPGGGWAGGMEMALVTSAGLKVYTGVGMEENPNGKWTLYTSTDGRFGFGNIMPGSWTVKPLGYKGSEPWVQYWYAGFQWGYANMARYDVTLGTGTGTMGDSFDFVNTIGNIPIQRMGWVKVTTRNKATLAGLNAVSVRFWHLPDTSYAPELSDYERQTGNDGIPNEIKIFNIASLNHPTPAEGLYGESLIRPVQPTDGTPSLGMWGRLIIPTSMVYASGAETALTFEMIPGRKLIGRLLDDSGDSPIGLRIGPWHNIMGGGGVYGGVVTDTLGNFTLWGFSPFYEPGPHMMCSYLWNNVASKNVVVSGKMYRYGTSALVVNPISINLNPYGDGAGSYNAPPYASLTDGTYQINGRFKYKGYNGAGWAGQCIEDGDCYFDNPIHINTNQYYFSFTFSDPGGGNAWTWTKSGLPSAGTTQFGQFPPNNGVNVDAPTEYADMMVHLNRYKVSGRVTSGAGAGVGSITIQDMNSTTTQPTASDGTFTIWATVVSSKVRLRFAGDPNYFESYGPLVTVPTAANPYVPIPNYNFALTPTGGGGGL